jgi:hypothetical protein
LASSVPPSSTICESRISNQRLSLISDTKYDARLAPSDEWEEKTDLTLVSSSAKMTPKL